MKKFIISAFAISTFIFQAQGQQWTGSNNLTGLLSRTGSVTVGGPNAASLVLKVTGNSPKISLKHDPTGAPVGYGGPTLEIGSYTLQTLGFPACGSGNLNLTQVSGTTTNFILSTNGTRVVFGASADWANCGSSGLWSKYGFNGEVGATSLLVGAAASPGFVPAIPTGYLFSVAGNAHVKSKLLIGDATVTTPASAFSYRLYVQGGILTEGLRISKVGTTDWADYVFADGYKLKSLNEVEAFVKANKHLPGVPSAEEVSKNGLDVVKMDAKLLEKIEELTLYVIELKKQNEMLSKRVDGLSK